MDALPAAFIGLHLLLVVIQGLLKVNIAVLVVWLHACVFDMTPI